MNKKKIINDPIYGFISIYDETIYDLIEDPFFQRLRRIKQLGLTQLVYPGATHTRLQHSLGTLHLMQSAISTIRSKGHEITEQEAQAVKIAILLHDIGHGPLSHSLESFWMEDYNHEHFSLMIMDHLNQKFDRQLDLAIKIYKNAYDKKFLHQLVSSQLDMDRLDYLKRDSFYTGVSEGVIGSDRIIKMLNVYNDQLVIEAKGIHSIEKFLIARWIMYWQVYFHKTVVSAEQMLISIFKRSKAIIDQGVKLDTPKSLAYFLHKEYTRDNRNNMLKMFSRLDDTDILVAFKTWMECDDKVLSVLCRQIMERKLYKIELQNVPFEKNKIDLLKEQIKKQSDISDDEINFFVFTDSIINKAYSTLNDNIQIIYKNKEIKDIGEASDMLSLPVLSKIVKKYFICYPKEYNI